MVCRYFLGDKELKGSELTDYMKNSVDLDHAKEILPEISKDSYHAISWTPGEAQAARYDLSKHVDNLKYDPRTKELIGWKNNREVIRKKDVAEKDLPAIIGKDTTESLLKENSKRRAANGKDFYYALEHGNLKFGGQGMKAFYDKMLVDKMNALTKKYGGKVTQKEIPLDTKKPTDFKDFADWEKAKAEGRKQLIHVLKITPELREHVLKKGFPLFASAPIFTPVSHNPFEKDKQ